MNISRLFIERPIMTALVMLAILLFGIVGYRALPVAALPSVDYPTIQVTAGLPGASPETMASSVATPLEREFSTIAGVQAMSSSNSQGQTAITIQFGLGRNIDAAAQDIQAAIAKALLPPDMPRPPSYQKANPGDQPILYLSLHSSTLPMYTVNEYAETLLARRISMISGIARVQVYGAQKYAVRIQLDPDRLAAYNIGIDEVRRAVQESNVNLPTGRLQGEKQAFTVQSSGQLTDAAAYRPLIVEWRNGMPVRLEQLADVIDSVEDNKSTAWFNGIQCMVLAIQRQPGTNTVEVVDNIRRILPDLQREIPPSINLVVAFELKDRSSRKLSVDQVIDELRPKVGAVPGIMTFLQNPPPITLSGQFTTSIYQMTVQSVNLKEIYEWVPRLTDKIRTLPGFLDVNSDLQISSPQVTVDIDRDRALALGVTPDQIQNALYTAYGNRQVSNIYAPANQYAVMLEVQPQYQRTPDALSRLYVRSSQGRLIPIDEVIRVSRTVGPLSVNHFGQLPSATVSFNLKPGFSLGEAAARVDQAVLDLRVPVTVTVNFQGTVKEFQESFRGLSILLVVALLVIYIVLGILYESLIHPITILSGLPSAVFGALLTLKLFHKELDLYAFVGLIMLFGVVKKNAIMMIDFALEAQRLEGKNPEEAIYAGCILRFRPIMMTTMAALLGTLPIALGYGEGGDARQPLGLAVVGGLVVSQFLTLYITPVLYLYMERLQASLRR